MIFRGLSLVLRDGRGRKIVSSFRAGNPRPWSLAESNLVDFSLEKWKRSSRQGQTVFYVNESGEWLNLLSQNRALTTVDVHSLETLGNALFQQPPDLVLIESNLTWADPLAILNNLNSTLSVPAVMICESHLRNHRSWLKKAFSLGASDTLFAPLEREDFFQTLSILLRFQDSMIGEG